MSRDKLLSVLDHEATLARALHRYEAAHAFEQAASELRKAQDNRDRLQDALQGKTA